MNLRSTVTARTRSSAAEVMGTSVSLIPKTSALGVGGAVPANQSASHSAGLQAKYFIDQPFRVSSNPCCLTTAVHISHYS